MVSQKSLPVVLKKDPPTRPRQSLGSLFFLLGIIALLGVGIMWGMGWLATESMPPRELYARSLDGSQELKRMAATEWARQLHRAAELKQAKKLDFLRPDPSMTLRLSEVLLQQSRSGSEPPSDPLYLSALATVLGFAPPESRPQVAQRLVESLSQLEESMLDLQVYVVMALARLGVGPVPELYERAGAGDSALRKVVAYALGVLERSPLSVQAQDALIGLSEDSVEDVRWNAAFALARHGNRAGYEIIQELLENADKSDRSRDEVLSTDDLLVYQEALSSAMLLGDPELVRKVEKMAQTHPNLKLRQAAKESLRK